MMRERTELTFLSKEQLESLAKQHAYMQIVGSIFIGHIGEQVVHWLSNGGLEVVTKYTQGTWSDYLQHAEERGRTQPPNDGQH